MADVHNNSQSNEQIQESMVSGKGEKTCSHLCDSKGMINRQRGRRLLLWILSICIITIGILALYLLVFVSGKAKPTTDYVTPICEIVSPAGIRLEDSGWPSYKKALSLLAPLPEGLERGTLSQHKKSYLKLPQAQKEIIREWVEQNEPAWQAFRLASSTAHCYAEYVLIDPKKVDENLPNIPTYQFNLRHISGLRNLAQLGIWHMQIEMEKGDTEQSLRDYLVLLRAARHWCKDRFLLEWLTGLAIGGIADRQIRAALSQVAPGTIKPGVLYDELSYLLTNSYPGPNLEIERLMFRDIVQHFFTKGIVGGGHLIPAKIPDLIRFTTVIITPSELEYKPTLKDRALYIVIALLHARRNETLLAYDRVLARADKAITQTPYQRHLAGTSPLISRPHILNYEIYFNLFLHQSRYFLVNTWIPAYDTISEVYHKANTEHQVILTLLALHLWHDEYGSYPETLDELIDARYLKEQPVDPYSDKPLIYRRTHKGFTLYSVGRNFRDDGGTPGPVERPSTRWGTEEEYDAVFWPID